MDTANMQFSKDTSEGGLPVEHEVIEEQDEHDEDERRTQTDGFMKVKTSQDSQMGPTIEEQNYTGSAPSTVQGVNPSTHENNSVNNSQSRIKVDLSHKNQDGNAMGMEEDHDII